MSEPVVGRISFGEFGQDPNGFLDRLIRQAELNALGTMYSLMEKYKTEAIEFAERLKKERDGEEI